MARLNDPPIPPPPIESLDALKRRFIRQNREIARVNSTQSLRIRNLETEISRLLSENISLREQAIAAREEAERYRVGSQLGRDVLGLKNRLEAKLQEVGDLVLELGGLPEKATGRSSGARKSGVAPAVRSPNERDWKTRQTIGGVLGGDGDLQEARLPVILEDKHYPRRTLETEELRLIRNEAVGDTSESPDLGPPPVAHFDVQEPICFDARSSIQQDQMADLEPVASLSSNLETRRKRRPSSLLQNLVTSEPQAEERKEEQTPSLLKSGAKRKLDVSELEEPPAKPSGENDLFVFQRRPVLPVVQAAGKRGSRFTRPPGKLGDDSVPMSTASPNKSRDVGRTVLAPKSTNSPTKRQVQVIEKGVSPKGKEFNHKPRQRLSSTLDRGPEREARRPFPKNVGLGIATGPTHDNGLDPKTPAAVDGILSPLSTEPSTKNHPRPQEAAVLNSVEDVLNGSIGRGSRRARAAVSYAEPSLRDKMRRPGKELVGAVEGLASTREGSTRPASVDRDRLKSEEVTVPEARVVKIMQERNKEEDKWRSLPMANKKDEPASPLRDKERKEGPTNQTRKRAQAQEQAVDETQAELEMAVDNLNIFDAPVSSPADDGADADTGAAAPNISRRKSSATTRRHSIQPSNSDAPLLPSKSAPPRPASAASVRTDGGGKSLQELKESNSVSALNGQELSAGTIAPTAAPAPGSRLDRAASRRRSMMV